MRNEQSTQMLRILCVPTVHHRESANLKLRTTQERSLRKNEIVELCEAFHLRTGEVRIKSPQSLMPTQPSTETSSRLNGTLSDKMSPAHFTTAVSPMMRIYAPLCGISRIKYNPSPAKRQLCTLNEVLRFKVFWFFSSEKNIPVIPVTHNQQHTERK